MPNISSAAPPSRGDVGRDRFQAEAIANGFCHIGLVFDDQHTHIERNATRRNISSAYRKTSIPARNTAFLLDSGVCLIALQMRTAGRPARLPVSSPPAVASEQRSIWRGRWHHDLAE